MTIALGIDTGGTYTDAVLVDYESGAVRASAKAITTHHDLSIGIAKAIAAVFEGQALAPREVALVALSTTLATNAIVEGQGSPICLLLLGYDPELIRQFHFQSQLVTPNVVYLPGGHDVEGNEREPLDEVAVRRVIRSWRDQVEAFAVSGYFSVRNPAHELRVRDLVRAETGLPVTCGHELTSNLDSVRRATTTALNARLISLLTGLIDTVRRTLDASGIHAPLMVVKGDGSLARADWIIQRPVETILSGPAASVVGAWHLGGQSESWVIDVGGTTTDIAALRGGRPRLNPQGARVGPWRTMVEAIDVHTAGLGGDSHVRVNHEGGLDIGPRRVVPLCMLASEAPHVIDALRSQIAGKKPHERAAEFVIPERQPSTTLNERERALLDRLSAGPVALAQLVQEGGRPVLERIEALESQQLVARAGFTPTDALHALGRFVRWDREASRLGAALLAARAGLTPEAFCERVLAAVSDRLATELVSKVLGDEGASPDWAREPAAAALLDRALHGVDGCDLACQLTLRRPIVAIGAPVQAFMPAVARNLATELVIPPHAEVANAVGAVAGSVVQRARARISAIEDGQVYRLHLPDRVLDLDSLEAAVDYASAVVPRYVEALAREAGAGQVQVQVNREDHSAPISPDFGDTIYLDTELTFTAVGRPSPVEHRPENP